MPGALRRYGYYPPIIGARILLKSNKKKDYLTVCIIVDFLKTKKLSSFILLLLPD